MRPLTSVAEKPGIAPVITLNLFTTSEPAIRTVSGSFLPSFLVIIFQLDIWLYEQRERSLILLCCINHTLSWKMIFSELSKYVIFRAEELPKQLKIPQLHFCPTIYNGWELRCNYKAETGEVGTAEQLPLSGLESYFYLTNWNAMINCLLSLRPLTSTPWYLLSKKTTDPGGEAAR